MPPQPASNIEQAAVTEELSITPTSLPSPGYQSDCAKPSNSSNRGKKRKISDIASRYAESAAQIDQEIGKLKEPEDEHYEYGRAVANKLRRMTPYQAALARRNIEAMLFDVQYGTPASATPQRPLKHTTPLQNVTNNYSYHQMEAAPQSMLGLLNSSDLDF